MIYALLVHPPEGVSYIKMCSLTCRLLVPCTILIVSNLVLLFISIDVY